ncbi:MAG: M48 family metalloprotease [Myxococcota bacterium]
MRSRSLASRTPFALAASLGLSALSLASSGCSLNQATGRLQLTMVSEAEEIRLGQQTDAEVVGALGLYEDEALSGMVERIGAELAAKSERSSLPWTFKVLDEPAVNAFALPGGFVYATRGLLVHLNSEDELAAVLGHEIGHVTARHGVVQLRKSRVAAASVGVFRIVDPNLRHVGGIAASTASLALLKHSRDDEYEADSLGLRYAGRAGYDRAATVGVFDVLAAVSSVEESERVPSWLSTHPDPELRRSRVESMVPGRAEKPGPNPEYLAMLRGVAYGPDPRKGFILGTTFVYPNGGFRIDLPEGWEAAHQGPRALASAPDEAALMMLAPTESESAQDALDAFFADGSIDRGEDWAGQVGGFDVVSAGFSITGSDGSISGLLAFIEYDEEVLAMMALGPSDEWEAQSEVVAQTFASFRRVEPALKAIEPMRLQLAKVTEETTLAEIEAKQPSSIDLAHVALLNGIESDAPLAAGTLIKRVEGFNPAQIEVEARAQQD